MACATFGLRCSRASAYQPDLSLTHHALMAHIQGSLLRWGTHTPSYRLKLSRDPHISAWCQAVQVSPRAPALFLAPQQPSCVASVRLSRYLPELGLALRLPNFALTRPTRHFLRAAVSLVAVFAASGDLRLGRRGELHPPAPIVAAPALLEACGFSVCLVEDWRSSTYRVGNPMRPFGQCACSWRSAFNARCPGTEGRSPQHACSQPTFVVRSSLSCLV